MHISGFIVKYIFLAFVLVRSCSSIVYPLSSELNGSLVQWENKTKTMAKIISGYEGCYEMDNESLNDFVFKQRGLTFVRCIEFCKNKQTLFAVAKMASRACYCKNDIDEMDRLNSKQCKPCSKKKHKCHANTTFMAFHTKQHTDFTITEEPSFVVKEGDMPERDGHLCITEPCLHNGVCEDIKTSFSVNFRCRCTSGYHGHTCQYKIAHCFHGLCHEGECVSTPSGPVCRCLKGTGGHHCQIDTRSHAKLKAANRRLAMYQILLGSIACVAVIIGLLMSIHCCRVATRRNRQASRFKRLMKMGMNTTVLSTSFPPGVLSVSNQLCREFFCPKTTKMPDIYKDDIVANILDDFDENTDLPAEEKSIILRKMSQRLDKLNPTKKVTLPEENQNISRKESQILERVKSSKALPLVGESITNEVTSVHPYPDDLEREIFDKIRAQQVLRKFKTYREIEKRNKTSQSQPSDDETGEPLITGEGTPDQQEKISMFTFFNKRRETREQVFQDREIARQNSDLETEVKFMGQSHGEAENDLHTSHFQIDHEVGSLVHQSNERNTDSYSNTQDIPTVHHDQSVGHLSNDRNMQDISTVHNGQSVGQLSNDRHMQDIDIVHHGQSIGQSSNDSQRGYSQNSAMENVPNVESLWNTSQTIQNDNSQERHLENVQDANVQSSTVHEIGKLLGSILSGSSHRYRPQAGEESNVDSLVEQNKVVDHKPIHMVKQPTISPSIIPEIHPYPKDLEQEINERVLARRVLGKFKTFRENQNKNMTSQSQSGNDVYECEDPLITEVETPEELEEKRQQKFFRQRQERREQVFNDRSEPSQEANSYFETAHGMESLGNLYDDRQRYDSQTMSGLNTVPTVLSVGQPLSNTTQRSYSQKPDMENLHSLNSVDQQLFNSTQRSLNSVGQPLFNMTQRDNSQKSDRQTISKVESVGHSLSNAKQRDYSQSDFENVNNIQFQVYGSNIEQKGYSQSDLEAVHRTTSLGHSISGEQRNYSQSDLDDVHRVGSLGHSISGNKQRNYSQSDLDAVHRVGSLGHSISGNEQRNYSQSDLDAVHRVGSLGHSISGNEQLGRSPVAVESSPTQLFESDDFDDIPTRTFNKLLHQNTYPDYFSYTPVYHYPHSVTHAPIHCDVAHRDTETSFSNPHRYIPASSSQTPLGPGTTRETPLVPSTTRETPLVPGSSPGHPSQYFHSFNNPSPVVPHPSSPSPYVHSFNSPNSVIPGSRSQSPFAYGTVNPSPFIPGLREANPFIPGSNSPTHFVPGSGSPTQFVPGSGSHSPFVPGSSNPTQFVPGSSNPTQFVPGSSNPTQFVPGSSNPTQFVPGSRNHSPFAYGTVNPSPFIPVPHEQSPFVPGNLSPCFIGTTDPHPVVPGSINCSPFVYGSVNQSPFIAGPHERSQFVPGSNSSSIFVHGSNSPTQFVPGFNSPTQFVPGSSSPTQFVPGSRNHNPFAYGSVNPSPFIPSSNEPNPFVPGSSNNFNYNSPQFLSRTQY